MLIFPYATLENVNASAKFSVRATVLSSLLAGITGHCSIAHTLLHLSWELSK
jgi:hypothetical protein